MPQIGWFELLVIIIVAILVIGPKDFTIVLKKSVTLNLFYHLKFPNFYIPDPNS